MLRAGNRRFQSTLPAWGETAHNPRHGILQGISIHSPRVGRDHRPERHPCAGQISIHSPRVGRDYTTYLVFNLAGISIHSPRVGRDQKLIADMMRCDDFNPLSPRGERPPTAGSPCRTLKFQSTLPAWGETISIVCCTEIVDISIHSPRVGRDGSWMAQRSSTANFNPLSPRGERLSWHATPSRSQNFNPLSPRGERLRWASLCSTRRHFNPLSPRGERPNGLKFSSTAAKFQSTLPAWGETAALADGFLVALISIHSPRVGRDSKPDGKTSTQFVRFSPNQAVYFFKAVPLCNDPTRF